MQRCTYRNCNQNATHTYDDTPVCLHHGRKLVNLDNLGEGFRIGILGGIFAGFWNHPDN